MEIKTGTKVLIKSYEALRNLSGVEIKDDDLIYQNGRTLLYSYEITNCGKTRIVQSRSDYYITTKVNNNWYLLPKICIEEIIEE